MDIIFYVIFLGFFGQSVLWYLHLTVSFRWLENHFYINGQIAKKEIVVLIPVLDEVKRLPETVNYFLNKFTDLDLNILLITTEKEYEINDKNSFNTISLVKEISQKNPRIIHYHYPLASGKMAHQLNYGIKKLAEEKNISNSLLALYNADSRPHPDTFRWILKMSYKDDNLKVFQQYGDYTKNLSDFRGFFRKAILGSAALQQTQWSVGAEIFRALKQFKRKNQENIFSTNFNHCIGHGLIFTKEIFDKVGGFSEESHNEDAIFGLKLSYLKEIITPIPMFDLSDTPDGLASLIKQRASWYFGPMQAFYYYSEVIKDNVNGKIDKAKLFVLCCKLFRNAVNWALGPLFLFISLIILVFNFNIFYLILFAIQILGFLIVPQLVTYSYITNSHFLGNHQKTKNVIYLIIFGSIFNYLLYGLSAYMAIFKYCKCVIFKKEIKKEKTKMI